MGRVGLVLLAAGNSSRMGSAKQLLAYRGRALVRHAAEIALASVCDPVVVVVGARTPEVRQALAGLKLEIVENPRWAEGMGTSIQVGVSAAANSPLDGVVLALADQPRVTATVLDRLVEAHRDTGRPIVASGYAGTAGVPAFFARTLFEELLALHSGAGAKPLITRDPHRLAVLDCPEAALDVDTPEDYERAVR